MPTNIGIIGYRKKKREVEKMKFVEKNYSVVCERKDYPLLKETLYNLCGLTGILNVVAEDVEDNLIDINIICTPCTLLAVDEVLNSIPLPIVES